MPSIPEQGQSLTQREAEVMTTLATDGCTAKEAARKLGISHRTVEIHVANAVVKLGARNSMHAVLMWDRKDRKQGGEKSTCGYPQCGEYCERACNLPDDAKRRLTTAASILEAASNAPNEANCAMCKVHGFYGIPGRRCTFCRGTGRVQWRSATLCGNDAEIVAKDAPDSVAPKP